MKKITYFWNQIFYNVWIFCSWYPFYTWLFKKKKVQKIYQKRGVSNVQKTFSDTMNFVNLPFAYDTMLLISMFLFIPIGLYVVRKLLTYGFMVNHSFIMVLLCTAIIITPTFIINEYLLRWKKDGYITYFEIFEKESEKEKRKWKWITFFTILLMLGIIVIEFIFMSKLDSVPNVAK